MATQVSPPTTKPKPSENTLNLCSTFHDIKDELSKKTGTDRELSERAVSAARSLITLVDLPLFDRCYVFCQLVTSTTELDSLRYAEEAVHFAEVAFQQEREAKDKGEKNDMEAAKCMLASCQKGLEVAQEVQLLKAQGMQ